MSAGALPSDNWLMTSDSANTAQTPEIATGCFEVASSGPISAVPNPMYRAVFSRNAPVPAAHLSFRRNDFTLAPSSSRVAFMVCPPTSRMVRVFGKKKVAPRALAVRSVTCVSANDAMCRPKPVATI